MVANAMDGSKVDGSHWSAPTASASRSRNRRQRCHIHHMIEDKCVQNGVPLRRRNMHQGHGVLQHARRRRRYQLHVRPAGPEELTSCPMILNSRILHQALERQDLATA
ncbi:hypothetical protein VPH35_137541 [Triticum aestivum]